MSSSGFPSFPKKGDKVKFTQSWSFQSDRYGYLTVNSGEIGEVLDTGIVDGMSFDTAEGYLLYLGIRINNNVHVLKFPYTDRPEILEIIPDTPAARVLFGRR